MAYPRVQRAFAGNDRCNRRVRIGVGNQTLPDQNMIGPGPFDWRFTEPSTDQDRAARGTTSTGLRRHPSRKATGIGGDRRVCSASHQFPASVRRTVKRSTNRGQRTKAQQQRNKETQTEEGGPGRADNLRKGPDTDKGSASKKDLRTRVEPTAHDVDPAIQGQDSAARLGSSQ